MAFPNPIIYAFDVDGTLEVAGGPVPMDLVRDLKRPGVMVGIVSARPRFESRQICHEHNLDVDFIECCSPMERASTLWEVALRFPPTARFIYVADRDIDREEALRAGWRFQSAWHFAWGMEGETL